TSIEEVTGLTAEDKDREVTITYSPNMIESTETKEVKQTIHYMKAVLFLKIATIPQKEVRF
ncbi:hypothetical protein, partial [Enterococcus casseliflavus]